MVNGLISDKVLLKIIIYESRLDTKFITTHIQSYLTFLDLCIFSAKDNILKFNISV